MVKDIYLAAGCFWGAQKYFKLISGVVGTEVGYANGNTANPTYNEVYTDRTGFAEAVHVRYDPSVVSLEFLLEMYFKAIDPFSLNRQGGDIGTRYRTGIYFVDSEDLPIIRRVYEKVRTDYDARDLAVEVLPFKNFYPAEEMHQDYLDKNPGGYCHISEALFDLAKKVGR